jgi:NADPH:quinone reductase
LLIRGATSPLGQAAINIAVHAGAHVIATTRKPEKFALLKSLGVQDTLLEVSELSNKVRELYPKGIDAVLELIGNSTLVDSMKTLRRKGRLCLAGFVGGIEPMVGFNPLLQMPSDVHFSFFGSFMFGTQEFPLSDIPIQTIMDRVASGTYQANPYRIFQFNEILDAHRLMESYQAGGKIVVTLDAVK